MRLKKPNMQKPLQPIAMINMIPFIDIILVLLFVFMISIPFLLMNQLPINLAKTNSAPAASQQKKIDHIVYIDSMGHYFLKKNDFLSLSKIQQLIQQQHIDNFSIYADAHVQYSSVIRLISFFNQQGVKQINLVSESST